MDQVIQAVTVLSLVGSHLINLWKGILLLVSGLHNEKEWWVGRRGWRTPWVKPGEARNFLLYIEHFLLINQGYSWYLKNLAILCDLFGDGENATLSKVGGDLQIVRQKVTDWIT